MKYIFSALFIITALALVLPCTKPVEAILPDNPNLLDINVVMNGDFNIITLKSGNVTGTEMTGEVKGHIVYNRREPKDYNFNDMTVTFQYNDTIKFDNIKIYVNGQEIKL